MKLSDKKHLSLVFKILFFFVASLITVLLIPDSNKFSFEFQKGGPWKHESLIAEFDFPVFKSENLLRNERDSVLKYAKPYFIYNPDVSKNVINEFNADFDVLIQKVYLNIPNEKQNKTGKEFIEKLQKSITEKLHLVYDKGIIETLPANNISDYTDLNIFLVKENIAEVHPYLTFYSQKKAYNEVNILYTKYKNESIIPLPSFDFSKYITYNILFDASTTQKAKKQLLDEISPVRGMIQAGERIIYEGQLINDDKYQILTSLRKEYLTERDSYSDRAILFSGQFILASSIFTILFLYFFFYNKTIFDNNRKILYFLSLTIIFVVTAATVSSINVLNIYIIPITILPLITATFYKPRTAFLHHTITILLLGFIASNSFEFILIQFVAGFVAISGVSRLNRRSQILWTALLIFLTYIFLYSALTIIREGDINKIQINQIAWFAGSSVLVLMAYPLIYIFEKIFGFISDVTLIELSDTNRPLLKLLAEKAPGTFQHSVQVANISEEAARELNANPLLARAGALYHDIGKMNNSSFFIENQHDKNPHDKIDPLQSVEIIKKHVDDGLKIAKKYNLPKEIIDFILTHHGTSKIAWFLHKYKELNHNEKINEDIFKYNGKLPYSKETAIVMIVDSVEAASRSLKEYTEESINDLVENIVNSKISDNLLIDADITFGEISKVKKVLKTKLKNIYHTRVEYPKGV
ncbi:MAG: HDIG domain-containing protein [Bacteroidales bacterium]|nr:HDIG domain-containing protein [Bacteroidales bacterium]